MAVTRRMTAEALAALPADGYQYDLIDGELHRMSPPVPSMGRSRLRSLEGSATTSSSEGSVASTRWGRVSFSGADTVLAPDVAFVRAERLPPRAERRGYLPLAPGLMVEVVSPSDRAGKIQQKVGRYLDAGVRLVWTVDPSARTVAVYRPGHPPLVRHQGDTVDGADVLPDLYFPVGDLFR